MRNKCFKKYFPNLEERRVVNVEYAKFSGGLDMFGDFDSKIDRGVLDPLIWWFTHGSPAPMLQSLALKLVGQPCSSSCCERNWSTYSFIHSMKRKKMTPQRAEDLVFVHNNLRLLSRRSRQYIEGESKLWGVGGDAFDSLEGAGLLEIASLSLDEPDMEAVIFTDEGDWKNHSNKNVKNLGINMAFVRYYSVKCGSAKVTMQGITETGKMR
ncbi:uncharacterized protein LOC114314098 [Camellia sinensis]|uniref:uncharacterized protein LOC114314098 n=1 Tax=Camellia sinensis TaxID=4442 RepID=UPI001036C442|nr:uncharacterized protein LOC114314098 [Camellia sinensis]